MGVLSFKADFLNNFSEELLYDENIFSIGEQKYQFHDTVYIMENGAVEVRIPFEAKKPGESQDEFKKRTREIFLQKKNAVESTQINFFDSAYAISVHKSQGSEWDNVLLFDESRFFNEPEKWLYTGITRAKKNLVIIK